MRSPREICYYFSNFAFPYPFFNQDYATDWIYKSQERLLAE